MSEVAATRAPRRIRRGALAALLVASLLLGPSTPAQTTSPRKSTQEVTREERELTLPAGGTAARTSPATRIETGGFAIAAFVGGASTRPAPLTISQPATATLLTLRNVRFDGRSFAPPLYYSLSGGYFFRRRPSVGVEAEFIHLKVYSDPSQPVRAAGTRRGALLDAQAPLGTIVQRYSISHGVNLLLFNLATRRTFSPEGSSGRPRFVLTGRAGVGPTIPHTESTIEGEAREQYEFGRLAVGAAGGAGVRLVGCLYAIGEYKFTRTRQRGRVAGGEAESLLRTHHGVFGLSYHF